MQGKAGYRQPARKGFKKIEQSNEMFKFERR